MAFVDSRPHSPQAIADCRVIRAPNGRSRMRVAVVVAASRSADGLPSTRLRYAVLSLA